VVGSGASPHPKLPGYTIGAPGQKDLLAEEVQSNVSASLMRRAHCQGGWNRATLRLLRTTLPDVNVSPAERAETVAEPLGNWEPLLAAMDPLIVQVSIRLARRGTSVVRQYPPDLLGLLVLLPVPQGMQA
jgi:hypothetical protein